jgi:hypothetical protein
MKKNILLISFMVFLVGCGKMNKIYICKPDMSQCITVFSNDELRFIVNGKVDKIPDNGFIKLDISSIDPLGDALHICWKNDGWDIVVHNSKVIETRLDTMRYRFSSSLPVNENGVPTEKDYRNVNCAIFDFYRMRLTPDNGAIVEY